MNIRVLLGALVFAIQASPLQAATIRVPQDQPTVQAGIDAAQDGDVVLVAPGTYTGALEWNDKTITLASEFFINGDPNVIEQTILDGGGDTVINVGRSVGPETSITGFTIQNGDDGIAARSKLNILNNHIIDNSDGIDYGSNGGGVCRDNTFENNRDDAIDLDGRSSGLIEGNLLRNNEDDGIEIRLHPYSGPTLFITIRDNIITGSGEDAIQLIDHPGDSNRAFLIERNLIKDSAFAGIGLMDDGNTHEDFRGADIIDPIDVLNNTFVGNIYGISGGANLVAVNNLFVDTTEIGLSRVDGGSIAAFNLFWNNGTDHQESEVDLATNLFDDPLLDGNDELTQGSPAIDAGVEQYEFNGHVLEVPASEFVGAAPDLGRVDFDMDGSENQAPSADAGSDQRLRDGRNGNGNGNELVTLDGSGSTDPDGGALEGYEWTENGSVIATGETATVRLGVGTHTITLTVTDDVGDTDSDEVVIEVFSG